MYSMPKPTIKFSELYTTCIARKEETLKKNLENGFPQLSGAAKSYIALAKSSRLYELSAIAEADLLPLIPKDLIKLYDNQMVKNPSPGRDDYDAIMMAAKGRCPFCSHGKPKTLDHYLPKSEYPEFSIFPANLVPCCRDCNHEKLTDLAKEQKTQFIHPYFDDLTEAQWLEAHVSYEIDDAPTILYYINKEAGQLDELTYERIQFQFDELNLGNLYSDEAGDELSAIEYHLNEIFEAGGNDAVRADLLSSAGSRSLKNKNSWQAAMYRALASDDRFSTMNWTR